MCPACYINGLLFLIFGASGAAMASNPWVLALSAVLTVWAFGGCGKHTKETKARVDLKVISKLLPLIF